MKLPFTKIVIDANPTLIKRLDGAEKACDDLTREVQCLVFDLERENARNAKLKAKLIRALDEKNKYKALYEELAMLGGKSHDGN